MAAQSSSKLVEELAFYGAYHSKLENQLIHIVCVPMILWSAFLLTGLSSKSRVPPAMLLGAYSSYYVYLDRPVGAVASLFYFALWKSADGMLQGALNNKDEKDEKSARAWKYALWAQVLSWGLQISLGHAHYEQRKPALLDSLFQAFSLAPLFVVYESIWLAFPNFQRELRDLVAARVKEIQAGFQVRL